MLSWYTEKNQQLYLRVRIKPNAKENKIMGIRDNAVDIVVKSPPVDGKANDALCSFVSDYFSIPKSSVEITKGLQGRNKTIVLPREAEILKKLNNCHRLFLSKLSHTF